MPELPDVVVYIEALEKRVLGTKLEGVRLGNAFLLRTTEPPLSAAEGKVVTEIRRVGKRVAIHLEDGPWLVLHLMIAGRLHWRDKPAKLAGRHMLASFDFSQGSVTLTEAGSKRRASLHVVTDPETLDPGGIEVLTSSVEAFEAALLKGNHTLKRALTNPHTFSGIGNAYSDEILFRAQLSPVALTQALDHEHILQLRTAAISTLEDWISRLRVDARDKFPEKVTAFREGMAVHGRFGEPCPVCGSKIQRIRHGSNEANYCAGCQTEGRMLADRFLSRLLRKDWPRTLEEWEERRARLTVIP